MSLTDKQIRDLNRMNRASQNVQLGTMLDEIIKDINTGLPGEGDMKKSVYATNDKSSEGYVDKAIKSDIADKVENAELSDGTKLLTEAVIQRNSYLNFPTIGDEGLLYVDSTANCSYRWDSKELKYYIVGFNYNNIKNINGGNANG